MNKKIFENEYLIVSEDSLLALAMTLKSGVFNDGGLQKWLCLGAKKC